jgi:hypothetical protein
VSSEELEPVTYEGEPPTNARPALIKNARIDKEIGEIVMSEIGAGKSAQSGVEITRRFVEEYAAELPEASPIEWGDAKELYRSANTIEQATFFLKGYAASCVEVSYGEESLDEFAKQLGESYRSVAYQRAVYQRLMGLENCRRLQIVAAVRAGALTHEHLRVAQPLKDDAEYVDVLMQAHDNGWGCRKLGEVVALKRALKVAEGESPAEIKPGDGFVAEEEAPEPKDPKQMTVGEIFSELAPTEDEEPWPGPPKTTEEEKRFYQVSQWYVGLTRFEPKEVASYARDMDATEREIGTARGVIEWFEAYASALEEKKKTPLRAV